MFDPPHPHRRGCSCLPTTVHGLFMLLAVWLWLPAALRFGVFVVGGQEADAWPLARATLLLLLVQLAPRLLVPVHQAIRRHAHRIIHPVTERSDS